jgi:uncharacterized Fe-S center protein
MPSIVYYGSPRQAKLVAEETLPAKLDLIIEKLNIRQRVKDEQVAIKMHVGNNIGWTTLHPVFIRKVVQAVKDGGGNPFVVDVEWDVRNHAHRGYSEETLGCPIYPMAGPRGRYVYVHQREYKNIKEWKVGGVVQDATFMINFSHVKGHPSCGFGAAFKNIALGCMAGETRSAMHDTCHFDRYWFGELCPDAAVREKIKQSCPFEAIVDDKQDPTALHLHPEQCNMCKRCLKVAPEGSWRIQPQNFYSFQEACANSVDITLSTFEKDKVTHLALATQMTPVCDCFGFSSMPILPDAGVFGSDDIVAMDTAVLDVIARDKLIEENVPTSMEVAWHEGHPFRQLHGEYKDPYAVCEYGEKLGLGSRQYELVDVLPVQKFERSGMGYISAK